MTLCTHNFLTKFLSAFWSTFLRCALVFAATGGSLAHAAYYNASSSAATATAYPWIDITASGTPISLGDNAVSSDITIGFSFNFGGTGYSTVKVQSNGMLQFGSSSTAATNAALPLDGSGGKPSLEAVMMPLWDDLLPGAGQVSYKTTGSAPNRIFTVSWNNVPYVGGTYSVTTCSFWLFFCLSYQTTYYTYTATFQVQLHENGRFVYRYGTLDGNGGAHNPASFTNPAGATIGYEVDDSDYVQFSRNTASASSGTTILWTPTSTLIAEYLFNEYSWNGSSGEVRDTSASGYHATAASLASTKPTTATASPAMGTTSGTCGYGVFNRANKDYVALPSSFPNLGASGSFTTTAWIRTTNNALIGQRLFADDENGYGVTNVGYIVSLGDRGAGKLNFYTRATSGVADEVITPSVIASNTWYFVAFGVNAATKTKFIYVYDVSGTQLAYVTSTYTAANIGTDSGITSVGGETNSAGGSENTSTYGFAGNIDEVRVYSSALSATDLGSVRTLASTCPVTTATLVAEYRFEESSWNGSAGEMTDSAAYASGPYHGRAQGVPMPTAGASSSGARSGSVGTCGYANLGGPSSGGPSFLVSGLPVSTAVGAATSVAFWMYWDGVTTAMPIGFDRLNLFAAPSGAAFGFNTDNSDIYGIATTGLANGWHHVVAVFVNGSLTSNQLYVDGVAQTLTQRMGSPNLANTTVTPTLNVGGYGKSTLWRWVGRLDELRVYNGPASALDVASIYAATRNCSTGVPTPGAFNAFDTTAAAGSITGVLKTKVAGTPFSVAVAALNSLGNALSTVFAGSVKVELIDSSDNSGTLSTTTGCRSSWSSLAGSSPVTALFSLTDLGRITSTLTENNAWKDVRVRISYPAVGTPVLTGCSTDNFAIRPASLANVGATDADWQSAGSTRSLSTVLASGGAVHKAGAPFTLSATAVNAAAAVTSNYTGSPTALLSACSGSGCPSSLGTLTLGGSAVNGVLTASGASYSEAGSFSLQLVDSTFAAVDAADGSTASERNIVSSIVSVGRFVPDHFDLQPLVTPLLQTFGGGSCAARSFTYVGQPFGWATPPQATVLARNAAGATLANYSGALWKLAAGSLTQTFTPLVSATPGLDSSGVVAPALTNNGNGTGVLAASASDVLKVVRSTSTPLAPFNATFGLSWNVVDSSEAGVSGNGNIGTATALAFSSIAFDAGNAFRYGQLKLGSAYGSELIDLAAPIEVQYWDGLRFATHASDSCTTLSRTHFTLGNYQRNLAACETALTAGSVQLNAGRGSLRMAKPGAGNHGSVDITANLGSTASGQACTAVGGSASSAVAAGMGWLQARAAGVSSFTVNPAARISFGQYKSPVIHLRESF